MYNVNNTPYIGLITEIDNGILHGHSERELQSINFDSFIYSMESKYPYNEVAVWYGHPNAQMKVSNGYIYGNCQFINYHNLRDYGINLTLNSLPLRTRKYKHKWQHRRARYYSYRSNHGAFGKSSVINDDKTRYEIEQADIQVNYRSRNEIYNDGLGAQLDWDPRSRSRKGSWKDFKIRHQWQKRIARK